MKFARMPSATASLRVGVSYVLKEAAHLRPLESFARLLTASLSAERVAYVLK